MAASGEHCEDGHTTVAAWCRATRRWSMAETAVRVRLARLLAEFPDLADEMLDGRLGVAQANTIAKAAANPRCGDQIGGVLPILLDEAGKLCHADFQRLVGHWERIADADGAHRDADRSHRQRRASWGTDDDTGDLTLRRTDTQRRADAIVAMATAAASTPADAQHPEPLVNIVVDQHTFDHFLRHHAGTGQGADTGADDAGARSADPVDAEAESDDSGGGWRAPVHRWRGCSSTDGHPIPVADAIAAALIGRIRVVVTDRRGVILHMGRKQRLFTGTLREAVMLGAHTCIWNGCDRPASSCQADHVTDWQHIGTTDIRNGAPLCAHHNRFKSHGFRIRRDDTGHWHTYRPDLTEI